MDYQRLAGSDYLGRRWLIVAEVAAGSGQLVEFMRSNGATDFMLLAGTEGVGDQPDIPILLLDTHGDSIMQGIRAFERAVLDLPSDVRDAIDRFDPRGEAGVIFAGFGANDRIAGRPVYGAKRPEWLALEDKIAILDLWKKARIPTAESQVVKADLDMLTEAHARLDEGRRTVWVADNRTGWHGGGEYLRRVRTPDDLGATVDFMAANADLVRVMPFLEGLPCSIHAFVAADGIATFRPVEMLTMWQGIEPVYAGLATTWDPAPADRAEMRAAARAVAEVLAADVSYRGPFSLDGVLTKDGFRPTEVNLRLSAGLGVQLTGLEDVPLGALTRFVVEHPDEPIDIGELERRIVSHADDNRSTRGMFTSSTTLESDERTVSHRDGGLADDPDGLITLKAGPSTHGGVVFVFAQPGVVHAGTSFAPVIASCVPYVETWLDIDIGELEYAEDVRSG